MDNKYTFFDYVDADGSGVNVINEWLNGSGKEAKAYFNLTIAYLEVSPPPRSHDTHWQYPATLPLSGKWKGFIEIRKKAKRVQYRLIGKMVGREVLLVTWGYHKGKWEPDITPQKANYRVNQMLENPKRYRREHDNR